MEVKVSPQARAVIAGTRYHRVVASPSAPVPPRAQVPAAVTGRIAARADGGAVLLGAALLLAAGVPGDDVLFDGADLSPSCQGAAESDPTFLASLAGTHDTVELRLMFNQDATNEDMSVTLLDLWVR